LTPASLPLQRDLDWRPAADGLIDHAISLCELEELIEFVLRGVDVEIETKTDLRKPDRRLLVDAQRAAKIEVAFGRDCSGAERNVERGRDRLVRKPTHSKRVMGALDGRVTQYEGSKELVPGITSMPTPEHTHPVTRLSRSLLVQTTSFIR
jgi:hypothetical protein